MQTETPTLPPGAGMGSAGAGSGLNFSSHLAAARRRVKPMALAAIAVSIAGILVAFLWPPTYRSTGTILIEQQEIPTDFVRSAVTSFADQRVQVISQRVMTSANLLAVIEKFNLFAGERDQTTREALVDAMRHDINLEMISADVVDPRQGRATKATIAFSVSYDHRNPQTAARVANELVSLYLSENIETRKQLAADTAGFLQGESERIGKRVSELEQQIAVFKEKNSAKLPELAQVNMQMLDRGEQELRDIDTRTRSLDQQLLFLDAQLAQMNPTGAVYTETGERVLSSADRLKVLRSQYASAAAEYKPDHPDVVRLKRAVESLEAQGVAGGTSGTEGDLVRRLTDARGELDVARKRYSPEHPDVNRLEREVATLEDNLRTNSNARVLAPGLSEIADNPAYIQLRTQREAARNERRSLLTQSAAVRMRISELERRQAQAPTVERDYNFMLRDLQGEQAKYNELRQKGMEAQLVENLETERKGERFTLIEPPVQAQEPIRPNRKAILLLGFLLAVATALGLMLLLEANDTHVRDRAHLVQLLGVAPLAVIPFMDLPGDVKKRRGTRIKLVIGAVVATAAMAAVIHIFVRPLDVVWLTALRRFGG